MSRNHSPLSLLRNVVLLSVGIALCTQHGYAQDALSFSKNWFVTGDVAFASVALRSTGVDHYTTGIIQMRGVPCISGGTSIIPANADGSCPSGSVSPDIVAAVLYYQTEETSPDPSPRSMNGWFNPQSNPVLQPFVAKTLGNPNNPACWSSGGTPTNNNGAGRAYNVDVLKQLPIDPVRNIRVANGDYTVKLIESGGNGNGNVFLTNGATLAVIWRGVQLNVRVTLGCPLADAEPIILPRLVNASNSQRHHLSKVFQGPPCS